MCCFQLMYGRSCVVQTTQGSKTKGYVSLVCRDPGAKGTKAML